MFKQRFCVIAVNSNNKQRVNHALNVQQDVLSAVDNFWSVCFEDSYKSANYDIYIVKKIFLHDQLLLQAKRS